MTCLVKYIPHYPSLKCLCTPQDILGHPSYWNRSNPNIPCRKYPCTSQVILGHPSYWNKSNLHVPCLKLVSLYILGYTRKSQLLEQVKSSCPMSQVSQDIPGHPTYWNRLNPHVPCLKFPCTSQDVLGHPSYWNRSNLRNIQFVEVEFGTSANKKL